MKVVANPELRERTTLRIGGRAQAEVWLQSERDWDEWTEFVRREGLLPLVLGRGSNLLVQDGELPLCLVRPGWRTEPDIVSWQPDTGIVRVQAGCPLPKFLSWMQKHGFSGLEGMTGVPGTVGGAVAMNAGSFGHSMGDCLHRVQCWSPGQGLVWLDREQMECAYRFFRPHVDSEDWIIHQVECRFVPSQPSQVRRTMRQHFTAKRRTQPVGQQTCGCTFKNAEQAAAGLLLDQSGLRGRRVGDLGFSQQHANFLVNYGQGTFAQAEELIAQARQEVRRRHGVGLQLEVQVVNPGGDTL